MSQYPRGRFFLLSAVCIMTVEHSSWYSKFN